MIHDDENKLIPPIPDAEVQAEVKGPIAPIMPDENAPLAEAADPDGSLSEEGKNPPCAENCPHMAEGEEQPAQAQEDEEAKNAPVEVVGIRFRQSGKVYYFAPGDIKLNKGDGAIVETQRGQEYGTVAVANRTVTAREIVQPLRSVVRPATEEDTAHHLANLEQEDQAYNVCLEKIESLRLEMKLVDVEYTFDNSKLLFYFTADGRIDFRDLVKYLASVFRTRIELRQIGIRDEAKMRGGLGICGRPFCCGTFLSDFAQVSIKMAKEQNLSLNSSKISGTCGRLMCCLRYEYDTYVEEIAKTPKVDMVVTTPDGDGYVMETSPLAGMCRVKLLTPPDAAPKYFHRDDLTFKGIYRKDLGPIAPPPRPSKEEKGEHDKNKRSLRRGKREKGPQEPRGKEEAPPKTQNTEANEGKKKENA